MNEQKPQTVNDMRATALTVALNNTNIVSRLCYQIQAQAERIAELEAENTKLKAGSEAQVPKTEK